MVKIYVVRHCEAAGNKARVFQGSTDCEISETGEIQLKYLWERFKNIHIDKVYSSPLKRAYKTALAATHGKGLEVIKEPLLREICGGIIEGMSFEDIFKKYEDLEICWNDFPQDFAPPKGESMREVYERVWKGVLKIANDPENQGKTILISSHGAAIRNLLCHALFDTIDRLNEVPWSNNTAVSLLVFDEKGVKVEFINDSSHVPDRYMPRRNRITSAIKPSEVTKQ